MAVSTKATKAKATTTKGKAAPATKAKAATTTKATAAQRAAMAKRVVALRHGKGGTVAQPKGMSWAQCAAAVPGVGGPAMARRLYNSVHGTGAHHGLLPGKGGRRPVAPAPAAKATKGTAKAKATKATKAKG